MKKLIVALPLALGAPLATTVLALQQGSAAGKAPSVDPRVAKAASLSGAPGSLPSGVRNDPRFLAGRALFDKAFHRADGLGTPEMNADSCRACHEDPVLGGAGALELNVSRFGDDGNGTLPFADLPGGQGLSKLRPPYVAGREEYDPQTATVFEQRQTPSILGAGLVDRIPDASIEANEDPTDSNGDGIYGVARRLSIGGGTEIGRFGWKAQVPHLFDFVKDAMGGELGITTPDDGRGFALVADDDEVAEPELSAKDVGLMHHFLERLPAPERGGSTAPGVAAGEALFHSVGCAICHVPALAAPGGDVPLYSNLLLHDVMPEDFRGMAEPGADVGFYKTPPLWGVRDTAPYLHDGRAATLTEAILAHESEAAGVTQNFVALDAQQKADLILFLEDL